MIISNFEQSSLISAVHQGILETPAWSSFLRLLRESCGADMAVLLLKRGGGEIAISQSVAGSANTEQLSQKHQDDFSLADPLPYASLRPERVYALSEFTGISAEAASQPNDSILAAKYRHARIVHLVEARGYRAWVIIARQHRDFTASDAAQLSTATGHFAIALRIFSEIERERMRMQISNAALESLNFGWMALNDSGIIIDSDAQAERLLTNAAGLRRSAHGKLLLQSRDAQAQLAKQLTLIAGAQKADAISIHLSDEPWLDLLLSPPKKSQLIGGPSTALIAYVHGDPQPSREREQQISQLFGLAPMEARLALALSRGRSIAQSAADQNISIHTARLYSKRIYAKTGTRGQADLVRLLISSLMALT